MPRILLLLLCSLIIGSFPLLAQTDTVANASPSWKHGGTGTVNFSQVGLQNWAAGGENSISLLGIVNGFANYERENRSWENALDLTYGLLKQGKSPLQKNDDRLELNSKYGLQAFEKWHYTSQLTFRSQLTPTQGPGGDEMISRFLSPAFILASIGLDYKPRDNFSVLISPFTGKFTVVQDQRLADLGRYGVEPARKDLLGNPIPGTGENVRMELGAFVNCRFRQELWRNITLQTKLDLFSNYLHNPQNLDVNWENMLNLKVNDYVSVSISAHLIYDDDVDIPVDRSGDGSFDGTGPRVQIKETFGIGLSYKL